MDLNGVLGVVPSQNGSWPSLVGPARPLTDLHREEATDALLNANARFKKPPPIIKADPLSDANAKLKVKTEPLHGTSRATSSTPSKGVVLKENATRPLNPSKMPHSKTPMKSPNRQPLRNITPKAPPTAKRGTKRKREDEETLIAKGKLKEEAREGGREGGGRSGKGGGEEGEVRSGGRSEDIGLMFASVAKRPRLLATASSTIPPPPSLSLKLEEDAYGEEEDEKEVEKEEDIIAALRRGGGREERVEKEEETENALVTMYLSLSFLLHHVRLVA